MRRVAILLPALLLLALPAPAAHGQGRVVGGTPAAAGEYPWQVALMVGNTNDQFCGGTLVAPQYVLTAAHCEVFTSDSVLVGTRELSAPVQRIGVATVRDHPLAQGTADPPRYDATMLRLDAPVSTAAAEPLALARPGLDDGLWAPDTMLTVSGWGNTSQAGGSTDDLLYAQVPRTTDAYCARSDVYGSFFSATDMMCAGFAAGGTDTCQGDSGGPIAAPAVASADPTDPADWRLVGITSWGDGCAQANSPGVYTRLGAPVIGEWAATEPPVAGAPTLSGASAPGGTVTCQPGTGAGYRTYRFYRRGSSGVAVQVAERQTNTYTLASGDLGSQVFCRVRLVNAVAQVDSPDSNAIAVGTQPPVAAPASTRVPSISGDPRVGQQLSCEPGDWSGTVTSRAYAFRRVTEGGSSSVVASTQAYTVSDADVGHSLACVETATNSGGSTEAASAAVGPVAAPPDDRASVGDGGTTTVADPARDAAVQPPPDWALPAPAPQPPLVLPPLSVRDTRAPRATLSSRRCTAARRCIVIVRVSDAAPSAGIAGVRATLRWTGRGRRRSRTLAARSTPGGFRVVTPRLPRGTASLVLVARDRAGNRQARATRVALRVR